MTRLNEGAITGILRELRKRMDSTEYDHVQVAGRDFYLMSGTVDAEAVLVVPIQAPDKGEVFELGRGIEALSEEVVKHYNRAKEHTTDPAVGDIDTEVDMSGVVHQEVRDAIQSRIDNL